jgi:DNA-binding IclR family transcriptional regulator
MELVNIANSHIEQLAAQTEETVWLSTEEHGMAVTLDIKEGAHAVQLGVFSRPGARSPLHCTATGKALLAHLSEDRTHEIIDRYGLEQLTDKTITEPDKLLTELEKIRDRGYATNDDETALGLRAVSAPVVVGEQVVAAVSVSGAKHRLKGERFHEEIPNQILGVVNDIELKLAHKSNQISGIT